VVSYTSSAYVAGRINPTHPIGVEAGFRPHVIHVEALYQRSRMLYVGFYPVAIKEQRRAGCLLTIRVRICGRATNAGRCQGRVAAGRAPRAEQRVEDQVAGG
jgi:hypothetical protein